MFASLTRRWRSHPIVLLHEFHAPPYGGGNQFLLALRAEFVRLGLDVGTDRVGDHTEVVLFNSHHADHAKLEQAKRRGVRMIHRVDGPIGLYRGRDDGSDRAIWQLNHDFADATVFQSAFSLQAHEAMGLTFRDPHVIHNAADPTIFFPSTPHQPSDVLNVVAASWSDNPKKGGAVYRWLDEHLDPARVSFTFVGRLAAPLRRSRMIEPLPSAALADVLRAQDVYVTASEDDPCSNALVEALSCGLPSVYRRSGGHPELVKSGGVGFERAEEIPDLLERVRGQYADMRARIDAPNITTVAEAYLRVMRVTRTGL